MIAAHTDSHISMCENNFIKKKKKKGFALKYIWQSDSDFERTNKSEIFGCWGRHRIQSKHVV